MIRIKDQVNNTEDSYPLRAGYITSTRKVEIS